MTEQSSQYKPQFEEKVKSVVVGEKNLIYNYFYYRENIENKSIEAEGSEDSENLPCPYRGLYHFYPKDAEYFFGREVFVEELFQYTKTRHFIPVLGASGSGKSSVILAGLVPKLEQTGDWKYTHFRPGHDPFYALSRALIPLYAPNLNETQLLTQTDELSDYLKSPEKTNQLSKVFEKIQQNHPNQKILLIADQFEELYTLCNDEQTRRQFLDTLLNTFKSFAKQSSLSTVLVATMRADFLGNALSYRPLVDVLQKNDIKLGPMNETELRDIIEKPAQKLGVSFESGLVERILKDVDKNPGNLPLLEFALTELWKKRNGKQLTHNAYQEIGQVSGALTRYADDKLSKLNEQEKQQVRRIFVQLVQPGAGTEDTRRVATKAELNETHWNLVKKLADSRLVVTSRTVITREKTDHSQPQPENIKEQETVEVVHEALIKNWGQLRGWMATDREFRAWQERLRSSKRQWEEMKRDNGLLLRGAVLAQAQEQLNKRGDELSQDEREFILESKAEVERLQKAERRKKNTIRVAAVGTITLLSALLLSLLNSHQVSLNRLIMAYRQTAEAQQELDALMNSFRAGKTLANWPQYLSLLGFKPNNQLQEDVLFTLRNKFNSVQEINRWTAPQGNVMSLFFTGEKLHLLTANDDSVILQNTEGESIAKLIDLARISFRNISLSSDGSKIATATQDGRVQLWDLSGQKLAEFPAYQSVSENESDLIQEIKFSPDDNTIITVGIDVNRPDETQNYWERDTQILRVWNLNDQSLEKDKIINSALGVWIGFDSNGELLIATLVEGNSEEIYDYRIKVLDSSGKELAVSDNIQTTAVNVNFSPDGKQVAIKYGEESDNALLLDVNRKTSTPIPGRIRAVRFHPTNGKVFAAGTDGTVYSLSDNITGNNNFQEILKLPNGTVREFILTPDGQQLVTLGDDQMIRLWNLEPQPLSKFEWTQAGVESIHFSPNGQTIATADSKGVIRLWDLKDNQIKEREFSSDLSKIKSFSFSPDGQKIATTGEDGIVRLLDLQGNLINQFTTDHKNIQVITWSSDGQKIATIGRSSAGLWDLNGKLLDESNIDKMDAFRFQSIGFDSSGNPRVIQMGTDNQVTGNIYWSDFLAQSRTLIMEGRQLGNHFELVQVSQDGKLLIGASGNTVSFFDLRGNKLMNFSSDQGDLQSISLSPDNNILAMIFKNGTTEFWELGKLDTLLAKTCDRIGDYLKNNPEVEDSDRRLCDGV